MEIKRNHCIAIILILAIILVYSTWDFSSINNEHFGLQWDPSCRYDFPANHNSEISYDINTDRPIKVSLKNLEDQFATVENDHMREHHPQQIPLAHNIINGQIKQTAAPENVNQIGASLTEIMQQERELMKPMHEMRRQIQSMNNMSDTQEIMSDMDSMAHEQVVPDVDALTGNHTNDDSDHPAVFDLSNELEKTDEEQIQKYMMKKKFEVNPHHDTRFYDNPRQRMTKAMTNPDGDYNLSLAILLSVLLIGFIHYTKE